MEPTPGMNRNYRHRARCIAVALGAWLTVAAAATGQAQTPTSVPAPPRGSASPQAPDYVIGPDDVLTLKFWREDDLSGDVIVRPDGRITVPLLNEVAAAGLTPATLKAQLEQRAQAFISEPNVTVIVKQMNSRRVFVNGMVEKPGAYPLVGPMTALQLIALAGGFREFANTDQIVIMHRGASGQPGLRVSFSYRQVMRRKNPIPDPELQPGDTLIVP
jgi:polysaccharide export outer membrane protein